MLAIYVGMSMPYLNDVQYRYSQWACKSGDFSAGPQKNEGSEANYMNYPPHVGRICLDESSGRPVLTHIQTWEQQELPLAAKWALVVDDDGFGAVVPEEDNPSGLEAQAVDEVMDYSVWEDLRGMFISGNGERAAGAVVSRTHSQGDHHIMNAKSRCLWGTAGWTLMWQHSTFLELDHTVL